MANLGNRRRRNAQRTTRLTVSLETSCGADDIVAVCCFVIDADQIEISASEQAAAAAPRPSRRSRRRAEPQAAAARMRPRPRPRSRRNPVRIRVDVQKVDQLINLVGELVITQSMLTQTASLLDPVLHDKLL